MLAEALQTVNYMSWLQALAEKEGEGMAKMIYRKDTGEILGRAHHRPPRSRPHP